jgi:hypothetical protein
MYIDKFINIEYSGRQADTTKYIHSILIPEFVVNWCIAVNVAYWQPTYRKCRVK